MKRLSLLLALFMTIFTGSAFAGDAKYVFLFIGDGLAMPQTSSAEVYAAAMANKGAVGVNRLSFTQFPAAGLMTTYDAGSIITDSASAGTAMATGNKTLSGVINMSPDKKTTYSPITYDLKSRGYRIGIVSSVSLDHATPASFYSAVASRGDMYNIGTQLAKSNFDYFSGGGFVEQKGKDGKSEDLYSLFKKNGYQVVTTKSAFNKMKNGQKVVAINETLQDAKAMPYDIDRKSGDLSLADHTKKAIEMLDNKGGFFLMVESGKVDWAGHANDAASSIKDVLAFDQAIAQALAFYKQHPNDTLIIVTGDHETGGMSIGFAGTQYATFFDKVAGQKGSFIAFDETVMKPYKAKTKNGSLNDLKPQIEQFFGFKFDSLSKDELVQLENAYKRSMGGELEGTSNEMLYLLFGGYEPLTVKLTQIMNQKAGIGWTSYAHTGVPVPVWAIGAGSEKFSGYYDNTDIYKKLKDVVMTKVASK